MAKEALEILGPIGAIAVVLLGIALALLRALLQHRTSVRDKRNTAIQEIYGGLFDIACSLRECFSAQEVDLSLEAELTQTAEEFRSQYRDKILDLPDELRELIKEIRRELDGILVLTIAGEWSSAHKEFRKTGSLFNKIEEQAARLKRKF